MKSTELLSPIIEEIANRWGFFGFECAGSTEPAKLPAAALAGLSYFQEALELSVIAEYLGLDQPKADLLCLPMQVASAEVEEWREKIRGLFRLLAAENPHLLGRSESRQWLRPRTPAGPLDKHLTRSAKFLERTYLGDYLPQEKKPIVADYRRSQRNYLASVDCEDSVPEVLLMDASSQIASHLLGFNGTALRGVVKQPDSFQNVDYRHHFVPAEYALRTRLIRWSPASLNYVAWCNSGAEAWEKAVHLAALKFPDKGGQCVCFRGSFHGRTLISLFSSWNPVKRVPFQLEGFETAWSEFPEDKQPHIEKHASPEWLAHWERAADSDFNLPEVDADEDCLLAHEVLCLDELRAHLLSDRYSSVSIEPMQCEGGDRFASHRFFQTLRVLTKAMGVALIFDEVQTGFGLGGHVLWSNSFDLKSGQGEPLAADFIVLAKKCQVGAVISSIPDAHKTTAHAASFMRGYINACCVDESGLLELGNHVRERLLEVAQSFPLITWPRAQGLAFAFDLPDKAHAMNFVGQRFYHGFMVYIAGEKTLRFRIQQTTRKRDLDIIFDSIVASLTHLTERGPECMPEKYDFVWPASEGPIYPIAGNVEGLEDTDWDLLLKCYGELSQARSLEIERLVEPNPLIQFQEAHRNRDFTWLEFLQYLAGRESVKMIPLDSSNWSRYSRDIMQLEQMTYEPARLDTEEFLREAACCDGGVSSVAVEGGQVLGFAIAAPLEMFETIAGPDQDSVLGLKTHLYSADVLVHPNGRGRGIGYRLKNDQIERAKELGYSGVRSRNRIGATPAMQAINLAFGTAEVNFFPEDYGEDKAPCSYQGASLASTRDTRLTWSDGVESPTGGLMPESASQDWDLAAVNKNSLCNWWTPNMTRYVEWMRSVAPLEHIYFASGRDEAVDKLVKCLIHARKGAQVMLSFKGSFWGGVTACARSLSDPEYGTYFPWKHVAYPYQVGDPFEGIEDALTDSEIDSLDALGELMVEPETILGLAVEPVQQMTGRRLSVRFLKALRALCDDTGVPLVMNESACWAYRGSRELFYCQATGVRPDLMTVFAGGQFGQVFVNDKYFLKKPLMLISTWDGDELSALRLREQIRMLKVHRDSPELFEMDRLIGDAGDTYRGSGLLLSGGKKLECQASLQGPGHLLFPALNRVAEGKSKLSDVMKSLLAHSN